MRKSYMKVMFVNVGSIERDVVGKAVIITASPCWQPFRPILPATSCTSLAFPIERSL